MSIPQHGYARQYDYDRAQKRKEERFNALEVLPHDGSVVIPEPDEQWHQMAKSLWIATVSDPASQTYTSGDWFMLYMACSVVDQQWKRPKGPSAFSVAQIMDMLKQLKLTETSKRHAGYRVGIDAVEQTPEWLAEILEE